MLPNWKESGFRLPLAGPARVRKPRETLAFP
jgi:hypothetical protein